MRKAELTKARRLLRKLDRIDEQSRLEEDLPKSERKGYEHFTRLREPVWGQMDVLASEVWKREVGLERYSVIRVARDSLDYRFQVLSFSFCRDFGRWGEWAWSLHGRSLRKNETLGHSSKGLSFREAHLVRRYLDGTWCQLRWPG